MTATANQTHPLEALRAAAKEARHWARKQERQIEDRIDALSDQDEPSDADYREIAKLEERMGKIEELLGTLDDVRTNTRGVV